MGGVLDGNLGAVDQPDPLGNHLALGKCAGLVGADVGYSAHSFESGELADDDVALGHGPGAKGGGNG
jgi:hypothetical protein